MNGPLTPTAETMIPDLLRTHPAVRGVLGRHGLQGCGGANGPVESLAFFARMHGVELADLLAELRDAIASHGADEASPQVQAELADTLYRRYFLTGMAVILSAGAVWGMYMLWRIGFAGSFTHVSIHHINAHGHAQIFGWVGLFIMGLAYQAFPRFWQTRLAAPRLAGAAFVGMLVGLVACTLAIPVPEQRGAAAIALAGGLVTIAAVTVFAGQLTLTFIAATQSLSRGWRLCLPGSAGSSYKAFSPPGIRGT